MSTVKLEALIDELPARWREGRVLSEGDIIMVTLKNSAETDQGFWEVAGQVSGLWADRTDAEIEAWQDELRAADRRHLDKRIPR